MYQRSANGFGAETTLLEFGARFTPMAWSPDGGAIVFQSPGDKSLEDIWVFPLTGDRKPFVFQQSATADTHPQLSPDGKWLAYTSGETGTREVYVRAFPKGEFKRIVSSGGGVFPRWRADGKELFYARPTSSIGAGGNVGQLLSVEFRATSSSVDLGQPHELFALSDFDAGPDRGGNYHIYAVSRDGQRFLVPRLAPEIKASLLKSPMVVMVNWTATLKPERR